LLYALQSCRRRFDEELLTLRQLGSRSKVTDADIRGSKRNGSLGQVWQSVLAMRWLLKSRQADFKVWVILGDSEMAEGSVWEASLLRASTR
jgi:transketolase